MPHAIHGELSARIALSFQSTGIITGAVLNSFLHTMLLEFRALAQAQAWGTDVGLGISGNSKNYPVWW